MKNNLPPSTSSHHSTTSLLKPTTPLLTQDSSFRSVYGAKLRVALNFPPQGRTKQSFKDECDINLVMARYQKTGVLEHLARRPPTFSDTLESPPDFQTAMQVVADAQAAFAALPSRVRDRFQNDPARFLAFMADENNLEESRRLGLRNATEPQATPVATDDEVVPQTPSRQTSKGSAKDPAAAGSEKTSTNT